MSLLALQRSFRDWLVTGEDSAAAALGGGHGTAVYQNNYRAALVSSLGSGLIDQSQKQKVAAIAMADMKVCAQRS